MHQSVVFHFLEVMFHNPPSPQLYHILYEKGKDKCCAFFLNVSYCNIVLSVVSFFLVTGFKPNRLTGKLVHSSNTARNIVYISMQTMQRFSAKDAMFPFCEGICVCKPRRNVFSVCMYSRSSVCVCCWKALFFVKH